MARKKVQIGYIACDSTRKSTYKKRLKGLLKKTEELSTLCGIDACAVIKSPFEPEPVVWPDMERAQSVVEEFRQMPEMDQHRKMFDQTEYLRQRVDKANQQLTRLQRENRERDVAMAMYGCLTGRRGLDGLTKVDFNDLGWMIDRSLKEISLRLGNDVFAVQQAPVQEVPFLGLEFGGASGSGSGGDGGAGDNVPAGSGVYFGN